MALGSDLQLGIAPEPHWWEADTLSIGQQSTHVTEMTCYALWFRFDATAILDFLTAFLISNISYTVGEKYTKITICYFAQGDLIAPISEVVAGWQYGENSQTGKYVYPI